jgi:hypothetical protein
MAQIQVQPESAFGPSLPEGWHVLAMQHLSGYFVDATRPNPGPFDAAAS